MKVSVLVPVYKCEAYIGQCLTSLFSQTYKDIEYVFVDDCSPDRSVDILQEYVHKYNVRNYKTIRNDVNIGIAQVRNILLANASGDYFLFVDSDDYIVTNAVENLVIKAEQTSADIVRQSYYEVYDKKATYHAQIFGSKHGLISSTIVGGNVEAMWLLFIRRGLICEHSLTFEPKINLCEDWLMTIKLFYYADKIVDANGAFYYYRKTNGNSITSNVKIFMADRMRAIDKAEQFLKAVGTYEEYKSAMYERILKCKQGYLINKADLNIGLYMSFHPEANGYWRHLPYGKRERMLFWLAEHKLTFVVKLIYALSR